MSAGPVLQAPEVVSLSNRMDRWHAIVRGTLALIAGIAVVTDITINHEMDWGIITMFGLALTGIGVGMVVGRLKKRDSRLSISLFHLGECMLIGALMLSFPAFAGVGYVLLLLTTLRTGLRYGKRMLLIGMVSGFLITALVFAAYSLMNEVNPWFSAGLVLAFLAIPAYIATIISALSVSRDAAQRADVAKSRFLANTSHEFRTPLNSILGMADLLADLDLSAEANGYVQGIRSSAASLGNTVQEMLDFGAIEAGKVRVFPTVFSPREVIDDVIREFGPSAQSKGIDLRQQAGAGVPDFVLGDGDHARRVLANLIGNSLKFTERGWVQIHLSARDRGQDKSLLCYRVSDSGAGFSEEVGDKLFNPFIQVDNSLSRRSSGSGLGLAIAKGYVEANNGDIGFKSTQGVGSEFWFTFEVLPASSAMVSELLEQRSLRSGAVSKAANALNVLIIDDQESNRVVFEAMLRKAGHDVRSVASGDEGIAQMESSWPDITLIDLHMPGKSGLEVVRWIRATERESGMGTTPVLVLTADGTDASRNISIAAGATAVLTKPLSMRELIKHVSSVVTHEQSDESDELFSGAFLDELRETLGSTDSFGEFLRIARSDVGAALERMRSSMSIKSVTGITHQLHTLKGLTSNLGMNEVSKRCGKLELGIVARQRIDDADEVKLSKLESEIVRALGEINRKFL